jgi:hypothetical protein
MFIAGMIVGIGANGTTAVGMGSKSLTNNCATACSMTRPNRESDRTVTPRVEGTVRRATGQVREDPEWILRHFAGLKVIAPREAQAHVEQVTSATTTEEAGGTQEAIAVVVSRGAAAASGEAAADVVKGLGSASGAEVDPKDRGRRC